jgi:hypothetical protein
MANGYNPTELRPILPAKVVFLVAVERNATLASVDFLLLSGTSARHIHVHSVGNRACQSLAIGSISSTDMRGRPLRQGGNSMLICRGVVMRRVFSVSGRSITVVFKN